MNPPGRFKNAFLNVWIAAELFFLKKILWDPFIEKTSDLKTVQEKLLADIISRNSETAFGRDHGFSSIRNYQEFCASVPTHNYEDLRSKIDDQEENKKPVLNTEQPVMYAQTSGTTGQPKYIPLVPGGISQLKKSQALYACAQYLAVPSIYRGKILAVASPVVEGFLETGSPFGSMSGLIVDSMPRSVKSKYLVPKEVLALEDYQLKYLLIAAYGVRERDVSFLASANPSTFLILLDTIKSNLPRLIEFLSTGSFSSILSGSNPKLKKAAQKFEPDQMRARELEIFLKSKDKLSFKTLWPNLQAVATWTGGSCSGLIPKLTTLLPESCRVIEMGYLASEFRGTLTVDPINGVEVPTFHENFLEFASLDDWGNSNPRFLTLDQIEIGKRYYLIATTLNGLYRYFINDVVEIGEPFNNTPTLRFVQKGKGTTNITGEKLYESQVVEAMALTGKELEIAFDFFILLADKESSRYTLYLEEAPVKNLGQLVEEFLSSLNVEYSAKLKSGRLKPLEIVFLKTGAGTAFRKLQIDLGAREGQFKQARLKYSDDCSFDFSGYQRKTDENKRPDAKKTFHSFQG